MANVRMLIVNDWDDASLTLTTGTPVATLPLTNTQSYNNARTFRTTTLSGVVIDGDFSSTSYISGFIMWRHNLTEDATYRLRLYSGAGQTGTTVYDSGSTAAVTVKYLGEFEWGVDPLSPSVYTGWPNVSTNLWLGASYTAASFKLEINDATNPDSYLDITRVYMGRVFTPTSNFSWNMANQWQDDVEHIRTAGGSTYTVDRTPYREVSFNLDWLDATDRALFFDQTRSVGRHKDIYVTMFPEDDGVLERDYQFAAKFISLPSIRHPLTSYFSTSINLREV